MAATAPAPLKYRQITRKEEMLMVFYDNHGRPTAYTEDGTHIYLFTGQPVAYFSREAVYGFNGRLLGWFSDGWIRDLSGNCVFYSENATGCGPSKPSKCSCPSKSSKASMPSKASMQSRCSRASDKTGWSPLSGRQFFGL